MACWSTKAAISLKHVKIEEKLLWRAHRNSPTLFRTVPSLIPYGLFFPKIRGSHPHLKLQAIISGTGKATDYKFGRYIHRVHLNKSPLKILQRSWRGRTQGLSIIFRAPIHIGASRGHLSFIGNVSVAILKLYSCTRHTMQMNKQTKLY